MARKLHMAFLVAVVIAVLMQISAAQTTHVVGNNSGWIIPPGGATFYPNWAANQTFSVGDTLGKNAKKKICVFSLQIREAED